MWWINNEFERKWKVLFVALFEEETCHLVGETDYSRARPKSWKLSLEWWFDLHMQNRSTNHSFTIFRDTSTWMHTKCPHLHLLHAFLQQHLYNSIWIEFIFVLWMQVQVGTIGRSQHIYFCAISSRTCGTGQQWIFMCVIQQCSMNHESSYRLNKWTFRFLWLVSVQIEVGWSVVMSNLRVWSRQPWRCTRDIPTRILISTYKTPSCHSQKFGVWRNHRIFWIWSSENGDCVDLL
jgi:hypothetical protein